MVFNALEQTLPLIESPIVVGISGGADSMVLLHAMQAKNLAPIAAHFNHKLRDGADQEAAFIRDYCLGEGLPFRASEGDVRRFSEEAGKSLEEAARILRYKFLFEVAVKESAGAVAVAHQADDQVETILMNLLRGSGTRGLSGMQVVTLPNPWSSTIPLVRPLLEISKAQILEYVEQYQLPVLEDPSNQDLTYHRNNIRLTLLPQLENLAPGFRQRLIQTSQILSGDDQALDHYCDQAWSDALNSRGGSYLQLTREAFMNYPTAIQRRLIRKGLSSLRPDFSELGFQQVEAALAFFRDPSQKSTNWVAKVNLSQSPKWLVFSTWETDLVKDQFPQMKKAPKIRIAGAGEITLGDRWYFSLREIDYSPDRFSQLDFPREDFKVWIDREALGTDPVLRIRREGDQMQPMGMGGGTVKISDLMINEKIPALYREEWPLLAAGDVILWVPGGRLSQQAQVTRATKNLLELSFIRK